MNQDHYQLPSTPPSDEPMNHNHRLNQPTNISTIPTQISALFNNNTNDNNILAMEEISDQFNEMTVDDDHGITTLNAPFGSSGLHLDDQNMNHQTVDCYIGSDDGYLNINAHLTPSDMTSSLDGDMRRRVITRSIQDEEEPSNILVVTNMDSRLFIDHNLKQQFESLFRTYDPNVTFRYLKSFRRVRLDFTTPERSEAARQNYNNLKVDSTSKCYAVQMIKSNLGSNSSHLLPPKPTRQFLISPPASPPVGWEPVNENSPCIDVQLISAIANLVPGKSHLIHEATESQPGIVVEVCDDLRMQADRFDELKPMKQVTRIAPTARPF